MASGVSGAASKHRLEIVQEALRLRLEAVFHACRSSGAFGVDERSDSSSTASFVWPSVDLHLKPLLLQRIHADPGATNVAPGAASSSSSKRRGASSHNDASSSNSTTSAKPTRLPQGDFTSHVVVKLANAWKAHLIARERARVVPAAAPAVGSDNSDQMVDHAVAPLAISTSPSSSPAAASFDLASAMQHWSTLLQSQLDVSLHSHPLRVDFLDAPQLRIDASRGYLNFFLDQEVLEELLAEASKDATSGHTSSLSSNVASPASATSVHLSTASLFSFDSLGCFSSVFKEKHGTPRQGMVCKEARGRLTLSSRYDKSCLDGLEEFKHIWLVFLFHENGPTPICNAKVRPPRAGGARVGLFATRTPHRPNPIGLSLARLDRISGSTLYLSGIDLIDQTPILDIKPYHPADCILDAKTPKWVDQIEQKRMRVEWTPQALEQLRSAVENSPGLEFYSREETSVVRAFVTTLLEQDPRTLHSKEKHGSGGVYGLSLDRIDVAFRVTEEQQEGSLNRSAKEEEEAEEDESTQQDHTSMDDIPATSSSSSTDASSRDQSAFPFSPAPLPLALVFKIVFYPPAAGNTPASARPKLRTKEWLAGLQEDIAALETAEAAGRASGGSAMED